MGSEVKNTGKIPKSFLIYENFWPEAYKSIIYNCVNYLIKIPGDLGFLLSNLQGVKL